MTKVGLLSDTHSWWDEKYLQYFESCDEIWHAGDIGSVEVAQKLAAFRPFRAVYGNIDGQEIRRMFPQVNRFTVDGAEVLTFRRFNTISSNFKTYKKEYKLKSNYDGKTKRSRILL